MNAQPRQPVFESETDALSLPAGYVWTPQEHWTWARLLRGVTADLSDFDPTLDRAQDFQAWLRGKDDGGGWDANEESDGDLKPWPEHRTLSAAFMRQVLFETPYSSARARPWVRIQCAVFDEELVWENESFDGELGLYRCRFASVNWLGLRIGRLLNLGGSRFAGEFEAGSLAVEGALLCRNGFVAKGDLRLIGARVGGTAVFSGATIDGSIQADGLTVDGALFCSDELVVKGDVRLAGARVGGQAEFVGAKLEGALQADGLTVEGTFLLREMQRLGDASLTYARVRNNLQFSDSAIEGVVDLTNAIIDGELQTSQRAESTPAWSDGARLILRNATVGALAGGIESWPKSKKGAPPPMELEGLSYARLGGLGAGDRGASSLAAARPKALKAWLAAGHERDRFTPGPYQQLAAALVAAGHKSSANSILHEMRRHERRCERRPLRNVSLWLYGATVGFGFRNDYGVLWFLALVAGFAAAGLNWHGLRPIDLSAAGWDEFWRWVGFSVGNAVPLIQFDKAHETFLAERFADGRVQDVPVAVAWAFYVQKALGFAILSFLAAGLTSAASRDRR